MEIKPSILISPFTQAPVKSPVVSSQNTVADGYAGTISPAEKAAAPQAATRSGTKKWLLAGMLALGVAGGLAGHALVVGNHAAPVQTSLSVSASQTTATPPAADTASQPQASIYSDPSRPEPAEAQVDSDLWVKQSQQIFKAYQNTDTETLIKMTSADGVWVRGLPGSAPDSMVHMTPGEFAKDLHTKGAFYQATFPGHASAHLRITPDSKGMMQTILLD